MPLYFQSAELLRVGAALLVWDWGGPGKLTAVSSVKPAGMASLHLETHD